MAKVCLVGIGFMVGALCGLIVAAEVFPLSTQETMIVRSR